MVGRIPNIVFREVFKYVEPFELLNERLLEKDDQSEQEEEEEESDYWIKRRIKCWLRLFEWITQLTWKLAFKGKKCFDNWCKFRIWNRLSPLKLNHKLNIRFFDKNIRKMIIYYIKYL